MLFLSTILVYETTFVVGYFIRYQKKKNPKGNRKTRVMWVFFLPKIMIFFTYITEIISHFLSNVMGNVLK